MTEIGEIIYVNGERSRCTARAPIYDGEGGILCYWIAAEPAPEESELDAPDHAAPL